MQFPQKDLTSQFISSSYQDVVQRYFDGNIDYFLDGYGNVIVGVPSSSIGGLVLTQDQTASYSISASFSLTSSHEISSSWSDFSGVSDRSISSSNSDTASYVNGLKITNTSSIISSVGSISVVSSFPTNSYENVWFDYGIKSGSNSRCGTVFGCWNGTTATYTEYTVVDIGNTSDVTMSIDVSGSNIRLLSRINSVNNWNIKALGRYL